LLTTDVADQQEEKVMSITVLDAPTRGVGVDEEQLPCHREDPELFFAESPSDVELAKSLCGTCPVRTECLASAIERREPWGVWGGQLLLQGVVIPRKRPRGRPRKSEVAA
jgi:WhiB family redox-sensing transcriptional regulator